MLRPNKRKLSTGSDAEVSLTPLKALQHNIPLAGHHCMRTSNVNFENVLPTDGFSSQQADSHMKKLEDEIRSVYGPNSMVYVTVLPTPDASPRKKKFRADSVDMAPIPPHYFDTNISGSSLLGEHDLNMGPAKSDTELGYESSYYSSEPFSPVSSSPVTIMSRSNSSVLDYVAEALPPTDSFLQPSCAFRGVGSEKTMFPIPTNKVSRRTRSVDFDLMSCIEYTGVSEEDVQAYISEQNPKTNRWSCLFPSCDKTFGRRENIRSHVQTHLGDRQFKCKNCTKRFVRQHDLKRHAKIHTGDKPYECPCGAGFARQDALTRHRQRGVCVGGFPNAIRKQARRGRPRKQRMENELQMIRSETTKQAAVTPEVSYPISSIEELHQSDPYSDCPQRSSEENSILLASYQTLQDKTLNTANEFSTFFTTTSNNQAVETESIIQSPTVSDAGCVSTQNSTSSSVFTLAADDITQTPPISPFSEQYNLFIGEKGGQKYHSSTTGTAGAISANPFTTPPHSPISSNAGICAGQDLSLVHSANNDGLVDSHLVSTLCDPISLLSDEHDFLAQEDRLRSAIDWMTSI